MSSARFEVEIIFSDKSNVLTCCMFDQLIFVTIKILLRIFIDFLLQCSEINIL
jgi:hypothetical protein